MKHTQLKEKQKQFSSECGFTLLEILASTMVILIVAAATSRLLAHPKQEMAVIKDKMAVVDYLDREFQALHDGIGALPIEKYIKCSTNNPSISLCGSVCGASYTADCESGIPTEIDSEDLVPIIQNNQICYIKVLFDPTVDNSDITITDPTKATQMAALAKVCRPDGGIDEHSLTAFFFRR